MKAGVLLLPIHSIAPTKVSIALTEFGSILKGRMNHYACRICNSEYKEDIEQMLIDKMQYRKIAQIFEEDFECDLHLLEQSLANHKKHIPKDLTADEKELLKRLAKGEVSFEEVSRIVAVKVFEKMLKNPNDFRYIDFFRTELLKIKQEEAQIKDVWAKELIGRFFAGKLPPQNCSNCGEKIIEDKESGLLTN